jgi:hypothetical protein
VRGGHKNAYKILIGKTGRKSPVADSYEYGNELSGYIKGAISLSQFSDC